MHGMFYAGVRSWMEKEPFVSSSFLWSRYPATVTGHFAIFAVRNIAAMEY